MRQRKVAHVTLVSRFDQFAAGQQFLVVGMLVMVLDGLDDRVHDVAWPLDAEVHVAAPKRDVIARRDVSSRFCKRAMGGIDLIRRGQQIYFIQLWLRNKFFQFISIFKLEL